MDLDVAIKAHAEWKTKLRMAITRQETLDVKTIAADNCCALGKWLHGEGSARYGKRPAFRTCVDRHAEFHRAAGATAQAINAKQFDQATAMMNAGTPFMSTSTAVGVALLALKKELAQPA